MTPPLAFISSQEQHKSQDPGLVSIQYARDIQLKIKFLDLLHDIPPEHGVPLSASLQIRDEPLAPLAVELVTTTRELGWALQGFHLECVDTASGQTVNNDGLGPGRGGDQCPPGGHGR